MTPYWESPMVRLFYVDSRQIPLPDQSVQCVVTSPPYYQLRRYSDVGDQVIGLEPTVKEYIGNLVTVFQEVRRVLRGDGILWLNIDDSYAGGGRGGGGPKQHTNLGSESVGPMVSELDPGNRLGIPERLVLALQADGWTWRDTIIWAKPNPMPESVAGTRWEKCRVKTKVGTHHSGGNRVAGSGVFITSVNESLNNPAEWADCPGCDTCTPNDGLVLRRGSWRTTGSHEYLYMLTKGMGYYADTDAVREVTGREASWEEYTSPNRPVIPSGTLEKGFMTGQQYCRLNHPNGRNKRSVWTIPTEPYSGPHYATFPQALVEPCILASTSERGCCPRCGAPWARVVERSTSPHDGHTQTGYGTGTNAGRIALLRQAAKACGEEYASKTKTLSWHHTCSCLKYGLPLPPTPCVVLDPFVGTGTTCFVAQKLGRKSVGIDLSESYLKQAIARLQAVSLPLPMGG